MGIQQFSLADSIKTFSKSLVNCVENVHLTLKHTLFGGLVGIGSGWLLWRLYRKRKYKFPPGPRPLPIVGNLHTLYGVHGGDRRLLALFDDLARSHGPVISLYIGPLHLIVVNSADLLKEAFEKNGADYCDRPVVNTCDAAECRLHSQRLLLAQALSEYLRTPHVHAALDAAFTATLVPRRGEDGETVCPAAETAALLAHNAMAQLCFGTSLSADDAFIRRLRALQAEYEAAAGGPGLLMVTLFPAARHIPTSLMRLVTSLSNLWRDYLSTNITQHMQQHTPGDESDFTHYLLSKMSCSDKGMSRQFQEDTLKFLLLDLIQGGADKTSHTLAWLWHYLAASPEVQSMARRDAENVATTTVDRGEDSGDTWSPSNHDAPYVDAVVREVLRLRPAVPVTLRRARRRSTLGGYDIPAGSLLLGNLWSVHHDPAHWSPDPEAFRPERWLDGEGRLNDGSGSEAAFLPFSVGHRSCVGESLALTITRVFTVCLLQDFHLERPTPDDGQVVEAGAAVRAPRHWSLVLTPRGQLGGVAKTDGVLSHSD